MNNATQAYCRRNYFIDKGFQADFIVKFCFLVVVAGLLTIGIVYLLAAQATTVSIVDSRVVVRSAADFILPVLAQTVAVVVIFAGLAAILLTVLFTHRLAGPMFRFKKVLEALEQGDFSQGFKIRNLDQLQALADSLNLVIANSKGRLSGLKNVLSSLEANTEGLMAGASEEQKHRVMEIKAALADMKKQLEYFKTT